MRRRGAPPPHAQEFDAAFYASRLAGGVDVYIPVGEGGPLKIKKEERLHRVAYLESVAFKKRLLEGWREMKKEELV